MGILRKNVVELVSLIEQIQKIMIDVSTGGPQIQDMEEEYGPLYFKLQGAIELMQQSGIEIENPNPFQSLWNWYDKWRSMGKYQERRIYIRAMYSPILARMQAVLHSTANDDEDVRELLINRFPPQKSGVERSGQLMGEPSMDSMKEFQKNYPDSSKVGFIMMEFAKTPLHVSISSAIKDTLASHQLTGMRADDREFHAELFSNIQIYMHGCGFGIAVIERISSDKFNPNVSLEIGYMLALQKPICILKDKTVQILHADLMGRLYREFDPQAVSDTIPGSLSKWLSDKQLI